MRRRAQGALEYLFMLAAVLILVIITIKVVLDSIGTITKAVGEYTSEVRKQLLEEL
ncbi:class III signal peptide-containing protein [Thermococcus sp.]|uniref:class III signal peptide-containing protein n=1 Tax=Thermococcus sp. TaxID=35749 RepID=UPI00262DE192|nr:class III signal peptide-containing protein [Thermococcus sp.]